MAKSKKGRKKTPSKGTGSTAAKASGSGPSQVLGPGAANGSTGPQSAPSGPSTPIEFGNADQYFPPGQSPKVRVFGKNEEVVNSAFPKPPVRFSGLGDGSVLNFAASKDGTSLSSSPPSGLRPGLLFTASQLAGGHVPLSQDEESKGTHKPSSNDKIVNSDIRPMSPPLDPPPMAGEAIDSDYRDHPALMPKEEYLAKQNKVFQELTGYPSWNEHRAAGVSDDRQDHHLRRITELVVAGLDEEIYNEFREQRFIQDEVEWAGQQALAVGGKDPEETTQEVIANVIRDYQRLKSQVSRLELEFIRMRKARVDIENDRNDAHTSYHRELMRRVKLEQLCRVLHSKVVMYEEGQKRMEQSQEKATTARRASSPPPSQPQQQPRPTITDTPKTDKANAQDSTLLQPWLNINSDYKKDTLPSMAELIKFVSPDPNEAPSAPDRKSQLKSVLKTFFDQYQTREEYFAQMIKMKQLQIQVWRQRAQKYHQQAMLESKRAKMLSQHIEDAAKLGSDDSPRAGFLTVMLTHLSEKIEGMLSENSDVEKLKELSQDVALIKRAFEGDDKTEANGPKSPVPSAAKQRDNKGKQPISTSEPESFKQAPQPSVGAQLNAGDNEKAVQELQEKLLEAQAESRELKEINKTLHGNIDLQANKIQALSTELSDQLAKQWDVLFEAMYTAVQQENSEEFVNKMKQFMKVAKQTNPRSASEDSRLEEQGLNEQEPEQESDEQEPSDPEVEESDDESEQESDDDSDYDSRPDYEPSHELSINDDGTQLMLLKRFLEQMGPDEMTDKPDQERENQLPVAEIFKRAFGFDITGMTIGQLLREFESKTPCNYPSCPFHNENAPLRQSVKDLLSKFDHHEPTGLVDSKSGRPLHANGKPLYGPERPPNLHPTPISTINPQHERGFV
uniref:ARAD1B19074p n=1 Tax=Blastobotrys adeninivorans TaxID=409370 RepID=A0A060T7H5_BLAAD